MSNCWSLWGFSTSETEMRDAATRRAGSIKVREINQMYLFFQTFLVRVRWWYHRPHKRDSKCYCNESDIATIITLITRARAANANATCTILGGLSVSQVVYMKIINWSGEFAFLRVNKPRRRREELSPWYGAICVKMAIVNINLSPH